MVIDIVWYSKFDDTQSTLSHDDTVNSALDEHRQGWKSFNYGHLLQIIYSQGCTVYFNKYWQLQSVNKFDSKILFMHLGGDYLILEDYFLYSKDCSNNNS